MMGVTGCDRNGGGDVGAQGQEANTYAGERGLGDRVEVKGDGGGVDALLEDDDVLVIDDVAVRAEGGELRDGGGEDGREQREQDGETHAGHCG